MIKTYLSILMVFSTLSLRAADTTPAQEGLGFAVELKSNQTQFSGRLMLSLEDLAIIKSGTSRLFCHTAIDEKTKQSVAFGFTADRGTWDNKGKPLHEQFRVIKYVADSEGYELISVMDRKPDLNGLYIDFRQKYLLKILVRELTLQELQMEKNYIEAMPIIKTSPKMLSDSESGCYWE